MGTYRYDLVNRMDFERRDKRHCCTFGIFKIAFIFLNDIFIIPYEIGIIRHVQNRPSEWKKLTSNAFFFMWYRRGGGGPR